MKIANITGSKTMRSNFFIVISGVSYDLAIKTLYQGAHMFSLILLVFSYRFK